MQRARIASINAKMAWKSKTEMESVGLADGFFPKIAVNYISIPKGVRVGLHIHKRAAQVIVIISGHGTATLGKKKIKLLKGLVLHVPKNVPHAFHSIKKKIEMVVVQSPPVHMRGEETDTFDVK